MNGVILINKPSGMTSHNLVTKTKHFLNVSKAGHFGTLDPLATGLLIIGLEKATKLFPYISKKNKVYKGQMKLGVTTDTYDSHGQTISENQNSIHGLKKLRETMKKFEGKIEQIPPPYSSKKYKGKSLYKWARNNQPFELKPSKVTVHKFQITRFSPPFLRFEVRCSSGTYVRSLVHDVGQELGCGAHLTELQRTQIGHFHLKNSLTLKQVEIFSKEERIKDFILPLKELLPEFPKLILSEEQTQLISNGRMISEENVLNSYPPRMKGIDGDISQLCDSQGNLLALARKNQQKNYLHPFLVFK